MDAAKRPERRRQDGGTNRRADKKSKRALMSNRDNIITPRNYSGKSMSGGVNGDNDDVARVGGA